MSHCCVETRIYFYSSTQENIMKKTVLNTAFASAIGIAALFSGNAQALTVTGVSATATAITVTGTCTVNAGNTSIWYKLQGTGQNFTQLTTGANNCQNGQTKTKTLNHSLPSGTYKVRVVQGSNFVTWPTALTW
jgi:hypothetical protein